MKIAVLGSIHKNGWNLIKKNNFEVFEVYSFENDSLKKELAEVDGIALRTAKLDKDVLSKCQKLKIVSRHGVGYDNVDKEFLDNNKIALGVTGTSNAVSVAEHVMTMFLYLTKLFLDMNREYQAVAVDYYKVSDNEKIIEKVNCFKNEIACGIMFRKEALFDIGLYNENFKMREGHELKKRFSKKFNIGRLEFPLYKYRQHSTNRTKRKKILSRYDKLLKSY